MTGRVLVAGLGNIFLGDDGFGVEVARRLADAGIAEGVTVADYGISGMHLAYDASGYDTLILVDAVPRGERPGTVTVLDVNPAGRSAGRVFDAHGMQPDLVLGALEMLGGTVSRILVVGCEPADTGYRIGLSEPVEAALDAAVRTVLDLVAQATANGASAKREGIAHVPRHSG